MFRRLTIDALAAAAVALATASSAWSQPAPSQPPPNPPAGSRPSAAPAELQQLAFLIGDWKAAVVLHRSGRDLAFEARWRNAWIIDGWAILQAWRDPYAAGAELRTYNPETRRWEGRNFYAGWRTWTHSEGVFADGEFVIETPSVGPNGPVLSRERYFDIQPRSFRIVATRSEDGGKTWSTPTYEMLCTRID